MGFDLLDFYRGTLSTRRLLLLINHLPRDSAFIRASRPEVAAWGSAEHLIADLIDVTLGVHGRDQRWPRPGQKQAQIRESQRRGERWQKRVLERQQQRRRQEGAGDG